TIGKTLYPRPSVIRDDEGENYVYEGQTMLFVEVTAPAELSGGTVMFNAAVNWTVCKEVCLVGRSSQKVTLRASAYSGGCGGASQIGDPPTGSPPKPQANPSHATKFKDPAAQKYWKMLPIALKEQEGAETSFDGKVMTVKAPARGLQDGGFFPVA